MDSGESHWDQNAENCQSESDEARAGSLLAKGNTSEQPLLPLVGFVQKCSADSTLKSFDDSLQIELLKDLAVGVTAKDEKQ